MKDDSIFIKMNFLSSRASINQRYCALEISFGDACLASSFFLFGYYLYWWRSCAIDDSKDVESKERRCDNNVPQTSDKKLVEKECEFAMNVGFVKWKRNEEIMTTDEECYKEHRRIMILNQKERQIEVSTAKHDDTFFKARRDAKRDIGYIRGEGIGLAGYVGHNGKRFRIPVMYFGNRKVYPNPLAVSVYLDGPLTINYFVINASRRKHADIDEIVVLPMRTLEDCEKFDDPLDIICLSAREEPWTFKSDMDILEKFYKLEKVAEQGYYYWFKDRTGDNSE